MKLLMITPRVDSSDSIHGFIVGWVKALAKRVEHLWVVTPRAGKEPLPRNVTVYEVGRDYAKGETLFHALRNFHRVMWHLTQKEYVDGIFTHMYPKFALLAAPYAKLRRLPLVMWHTHTHVSRQLWLAEKLVDRIVTASRGSCRLDSDKIRVVGHGIDTERFVPLSSMRHLAQVSTILSVGRISPAKHYEILIEAIAKLVDQVNTKPIHLRLVGGALLSEPRIYLEELKSQVVVRNLSEYVSFEGAIPYEQIASVYQQASIFVSASQTGLDKAILEAMACGLIPVVSLKELVPTLGNYAGMLVYEPGDALDLVDKLRYLLEMHPDEREQLHNEMRRLVKEKHNVGALMERLLDNFREFLGKG
jgi:glycosyltransferase involved in cell wall biosynthesis